MSLKRTFNLKRLPMPSSRPVRIGIGTALIIGGTLGFLPILGFWMIPAGLTVLSVDLPRARRLRRRMDVAVIRRWRSLRGASPD